MKNIILSLLLLITTIISAEVIIDENFDGTFPPAGWQLLGGNNWEQGASNNAGGTQPEAKFNWSPSTTAVQRLASLPVNTVGATELNLQFKHNVNDFNGNYEIRLETSSDGVNWNTAQVFPSTNISATTENIVLTTPDVGSATFQLSWTFDGNSYNINYWYVDDVLLEGTLITYDNDLAGMEITGNMVINAGNTENYDVTVKNVGYNTQTVYTVKLFKFGGQELSSIDVNQAIAPDEIVTHNLVWNVPDDEPQGTVNLYGKVILAGDENTANDETDQISVQVYPPGVLEVTVGDGTILWNRTPVRFQYLNSLCEMLYFPDELGNLTGSITEITWYYDFIHSWPNEDITIWMGETSQMDLMGGWIPATQLTQVFDGNVSFSSGQNEITITFDTPYYYDGLNLVMMVHRPMASSATGDDNFYHTATPDHDYRTLYEGDDSVVFDPYNPTVAGYDTDRFANVTFSFFQGAMGDVEGHVYDDVGNPIAGAEIEIEQLNMISISNNDGYYQFGNVLTGTYDFTATKFGYSPQTMNEEVLEDQTITVDFNLPPLGTVSVSGQVVGSDAPTLGLENALVSLTGFENYEVYTDANGEFMISGVYTNITYDLSIIYDGYETYYDEVDVAGVNLDLETIILSELAFPPGNVIAMQNVPQTEVDLNWTSPGQGGGEFRYDDGEADFQIGFGSNPANGLIGAVHPNIAMIQEVQWYLTSEYGTHDDVKIVILGLDAGLPDVTQILHVSPFLDNVDDEWNSYVLDEQVEALEGFFVGINTPNEYTSLALDDGEGEPWVFEMGTHYTNENWMGGNSWIDIGTMGSMFQRNMLLRCYGVNLGNTDISENTIYPEKVNFSPTSREFEAYNVYRFPEQYHYDPASWDLVGEAVTDTFFTDTSWASLPMGNYQFAVRSLHTNGIESLPAYSAVLEKSIVDTQPEQTIPAVNHLAANYPNPFNPETTIKFSISSSTEPTRIMIFNLKGQKIATLVDATLPAGEHRITWLGKDSDGKDAASGVYLYKMINGDFQQIRKMLLLR